MQIRKCAPGCLSFFSANYTAAAVWLRMVVRQGLQKKRVSAQALFSTAGYTLIEILIVLFIIGIVTSVALLSVGHNDNRELATVANELTQLMSLAEEQAMLQPSVLGLSIEEQSFEFKSLQSQVFPGKKNNWQSLNNTLFGKHPIPSDVAVVVSGVTSMPQVIISTNGELTPFTIYVGKKGKKPRYLIKGDADGSVTNQLLS